MSFTSLRLFSISIRHLFGCTRNWSKTRWCYFVFGQPLKTWCCGYVCCASLLELRARCARSVLIKNRCQYCLVYAISVMFCIFAFLLFFIQSSRVSLSRLPSASRVVVFFLILRLFLRCKHFRKGWNSLAPRPMNMNAIFIYSMFTSPSSFLFGNNFFPMLFKCCWGWARFSVPVPYKR